MVPGLSLLGSVLHWFAAKPPVDSALAALARMQVVQAACSTLFGAKVVPPATLLSVLLGCYGAFLLLVLLLPKGRVSFYAWFYFFLSSDKKTRKSDDAPIDTGAKSTKHCKIVFIRHGESEWNAVFNEGPKALMPIRLVVGLCKEALMLFDQDSLFMDSPLSKIGVDQARKLMVALAEAPSADMDSARAKLPCRELSKNELISIVRGDVGESTLVSSILRRAISTGLIALSPRLLRTTHRKEDGKVLLMTNLQECSRNVDTLALARSKSLPQVPATEKKIQNLGDILHHFYRTRLDIRHNSGNKGLRQKLDKRQDNFVKEVLKMKADTIIVFGHSLWFQSFFKAYLPKSSTHESKTLKIVNGGCIAFDFYKDSKNIHRIPVESIKEIHGGFAQKKKKGKAKKS